MFSVNSLEGFAVSVTELENDGKIGIPLAIKTYVKDKKSTSATTPLILYIVGTNTERIGTDSDETIISDLLSRGYVVSVFDYYGSPLAVTPMLEESIQRIRSGLALGRDGWRERLLGGALCASPYVYVLPSGYNITRQANFWSFDRHGTAGQFDFILSVWNNDFLGVWGNKGIITYPDGRKESVREYTESLPNGRVSEIYQCIRRNAKPIEMNLYMDIIYPTSPEKKVPVMLYRQSSQAFVIKVF